MKKSALVCLMILFLFCDCSKLNVKRLLDRANACSNAGKYAEALTYVRQLVDISNQSPEKLEFRAEMFDFQHYLLLKTGAFREALENGFVLDELSRKISTRKSPWNCLKIADAYLGLKDWENAMVWIEKAVYERGFIRRDIFNSKEYAPLKNNPRLIKVIAAIEKKIGLNLPAKIFTVQLLDGASFSLSEQRGKVVLIDFWDVNCPPCRKEMPNLKKLHQEFAGKGLVIVGISLDTDRTLLQNYLKEISPEWKMACSFQGWEDATAKLYLINATPSSWLIDRQGILRHINLRGEELYAAVKALL
jgi:peroxiredoxin